VLRLLALAALAVVLWLMLEGGIAAVRTRLRGSSPSARIPPTHPRGGPTATAGLALVRCATCGVHLPQQRALDGAGRWYCSADCRRAAEPAAAEGP
jgi:uncharacterized protein